MRNEINRFLAEFLFTSKLRVRVQHINKKSMLVGVISVAGHDLASTLIQKGYAMINDVTIFLRTDLNNLRSYEKLAAKKKLGIWQTIPYIHFDDIPEEFEGTVVEIISSSVLSIKPIQQQREIIITLNAIKVPDFGNKTTSEPGGYEAYEYLRSQVGKVVRVKVNDQINGINYSTVYTKFNDGTESCVNEYLLKNGMATLSSSGVIKQPGIIKQLEQAEANRRSQANPIQRPAVTFRIPTELDLIDFVRGTSPDKNMQGIINKVYSPMLFLIDVPDKLMRIPFCLKDIEALSPEEYITEVAVDYLRMNYLNREITFSVGNGDLSNGNVCGTFKLDDQSPDIRIELLKNGYVRLLKDESLRPYEKQAKDEKLGAWSRSKLLFAIPPQPTQSVMVYVTRIIDPFTIAIQTKLDSLNRIRFESLDKISNPKPGMLVIFVRNNFAYRALIKRVESKNVYVHLIDYGYCAWALSDELRRITEQLSNVQALGMTLKLAFISLFKNSEDSVIKYLNNMLGNSRSPLYAQVVGTTSRPEVVLTVKDDLESMCVQYVMIRDGAVKLAKELPSNPSFTELFEKLKDGEKNAKGAELGFHGIKT